MQASNVLLHSHTRGRNMQISLNAPTDCLYTQFIAQTHEDENNVIIIPFSENKVFAEMLI